jgi:hypothetical protein
MLDFLKEQDNTSSSAPAKQKGQKSKSASVKKDASDSSFLSVDNQKKSLHKSSMLLVAVVCIGFVALFLMIKKGAPQAAIARTVDAEQAQMDALLSKLGGVRSEMSSKMDKILKRFYEYSNTKQIPVDRLGKNPFRMTGVWAGLGESSHKDLQNLVGGNVGYSLQLFSIIRADGNNGKSRCIIDDRILYVGDTIRDMKVTEIADNYVKLESNEGQLILKLNSEN